MSGDEHQVEAPVGVRFDTALARQDRDILPVRAGDEVPRAYPVEILGDAARGFVARFPDLPEAAETTGLDAAEVLQRLPLVLLHGLRQRIRDGMALPRPGEAAGRPEIAVAVEALPSLLLHQRMLSAGLDDAEVERRIDAQGSWSVAALRDPVAAVDPAEGATFCIELVMLALWVVDGGDRQAAFPVPGDQQAGDVIAWSRRQAALLTLALAGAEAPGLQCADAVDELRDVGLVMLRSVRDNWERGIQLVMEAMALDAAMGKAGAVPTTLLLRRAAEAFRGAETHADPGILSRIDPDEVWRDARRLTAARLEVLGLSIDPVPLECPISFELAFRRLTSTDITPAVLELIAVAEAPRTAPTSQWPGAGPA